MLNQLNTVHHHLLELGFVHVHHEADWEDGGDAENGPKLEGGPAFDDYYADTDSIYINHDGSAHLEQRDPDLEEFLASLQSGES